MNQLCSIFFHDVQLSNLNQLHNFMICRMFLGLSIHTAAFLSFFFFFKTVGTRTLALNHTHSHFKFFILLQDLAHLCRWSCDLVSTSIRAGTVSMYCCGSLPSSSRCKIGHWKFLCGLVPTILQVLKYVTVFPPFVLLYISARHDFNNHLKYNSWSWHVPHASQLLWRMKQEDHLNLQVWVALKKKKSTKSMFSLLNSRLAFLATRR